jgi:alpha-glucosidase/alpha-D-xyloside xylohydrolase
VDLATMPIYVRAGAIIPVDPVRQFTSEPVTEATQIRLYPGADGDLTLYDDDGVSQAYLNGVATTTRFVWNDGAKLLTIMPSAAQVEATRIAARRQFDIVAGPQGPTRRVQYDGWRMQIRF